MMGLNFLKITHLGTVINDVIRNSLFSDSLASIKPIAQYSGDLNSIPVWYSNGQKLCECHLNTGLSLVR